MACPRCGESETHTTECYIFRVASLEAVLRKVLVELDAAVEMLHENDVIPSKNVGLPLRMQAKKILWGKDE